jgi:hypothetical protein
MVTSKSMSDKDKYFLRKFQYIAEKIGQQKQEEQ